MENINWQIPLWKMKITNDQYEELKQNLHNAFISPNKQGIQGLAKEAALYYAEWWRREYDGGSPSKEALAKNLSLTIYTSELYELARKGGKDLNIEPIVIVSNKLWFRSLLIQGGLPINHIHSNSQNLSYFKTFLRGLVSYTKSVYINWNDCSFIENLPCTNRLPESFQNEGIYQLSLQIARAIYEEDDELFPYDAKEGDWKGLTDDLKAAPNIQFSHNVPFVLKWKMVKLNDELKLNYNVEFAKKISKAYIEEHHLTICNSFSLYLQNQFIATYVRSMDNEFICREKRFVNFLWKGEPVISLQLKKDNNQIIDTTAPNSFAPDFENPLLLVEADGYWNFKSGISDLNRNAIIYPHGWECDNISRIGMEVKLINDKLNWYEFSGSVTLKNLITNEEIVFDNTLTTYSLEFAGWSIDWVQHANYKILALEPDIRLYDENMERVKAKSIFYREYRSSIWKKYEKGLLPIGLLEFKIELPDRKFIKEKFYYTGSLNCILDSISSNNGVISWEWKYGSISPLTGQQGLEISEMNNKSWRIARQNNHANYPDITKFRLLPEPNEINSPYLEIAVASPFKGVVLLNSHGEEIPNDQILCRASLYGYRYVVMGQSVNTEVFHSQNPDAIITGRMEPGVSHLSRFEDNIREMFLLRGSDPFDKDSKVKIKIIQDGSEKSIFIKEYNMFSKRNVENRSISISDNSENKIPIDYQGQLYGLAVDCKSEDIVVEELQKANNSFFFNEEEELYKFILFSDKIADDQIVPRYYNFFNEPSVQLICEPNSLTPQEKNIIRIKESLEYADAFDENLQFSEDWKKVVQYYNLVIRYSLPFKTLNCFRAIASSPLLMVKMTYLLWQNQTVNKDDLLHGLSRFENELAVAWHWIRIEHWTSAINWLLLKFPVSFHHLIKENIFECRNSLLRYTLQTEASEIKYLVGYNSIPNYPQVSQPSNQRIHEIRQKIGGNRNLNDNFIEIPDEWFSLFGNAFQLNLPPTTKYIRSLLLSPVKAALTVTGQDDSLWKNDEKNVEMRRTINFYRQALPSEYFEILICMVKRIYQKNRLN